MFGNLLLSVVMLMVFFCGNLKTKNSSNRVSGFELNLLQMGSEIVIES